MLKFFTKDHEWIMYDNETNIGTVGITEHATESLGEIVFVELPVKGNYINMNDVSAVCESVKAASDVYSPVSGEVVTINTELEKDPSIVNASPEEFGWLFTIRLSDPSELDKLLSPEEYANTLSY